MDLVMTHHRHPIVNHPRVWQPWYIAGEGDKATVHPVDFSSSIHSSGLSNSPYDPLSGPRGLRLKRRPERKPAEVSKRCLTEKLQHVERCVDSKENVSNYDYLSDSDSEDQLSDEDTGKLVVDDNVDDEIIENNDSNGITKSPLSSSGHFQPSVESVADVDEDSRGGGLRVKAKDAGVRLVVEERRTDEERDEDEVGSRNDNLGLGEDPSLEDEDSPIDDKDEEEQEGPLDMTTNNRGRNGIGGNPRRWSPSSSPTASVNLSSVFYPHHPPRYNPYVSTAPPPPPYHALPPHHLSSRPHSASPPPYLPPSYISPNLFGDSNGHRGAPLRPAHTVQQQHRPSVITCANTTSSRGSPPPPPLPSHHQPHHHHLQHQHKAQSLAVNHHRTCLPSAGPNDLSSTNSGLGMINRRTLSDPTAGIINSSGSGNGGGSLYKSRRSSDHGRVGHRRELLSGMCDPVIDEHFRRSLGKDYPEYLSSSIPNKASHNNNYKRLSTVGSANSSPFANASSTSSVSNSGMTVDDHFAKALGETWLLLQSKGIPSSSSPASPSVAAGSSPSSKPSSPTISLGSGYVSNSMSPKSVSPSPAVQQRQSIVST